MHYASPALEQLVQLIHPGQLMNAILEGLYFLGILFLYHAVIILWAILDNDFAHIP
jgi:prolipoprotein diacylglyceryltransferase